MFPVWGSVQFVFFVLWLRPSARVRSTRKAARDTSADPTSDAETAYPTEPQDTKIEVGCAYQIARLRFEKVVFLTLQTSYLVGTVDSFDDTFFEAVYVEYASGRSPRKAPGDTSAEPDAEIAYL